MQVARLAKLVGATRFLAGEYLIDCGAQSPDIDFVIGGQTYTLSVRAESRAWGPKCTIDSHVQIPQ